MKENTNNQGILRLAYGTNNKGEYFFLPCYSSSILPNLHSSILNQSEAIILEKFNETFKNNENFFNLLLEQKDHWGRTLLHCATFMSKPKVVEELIKYGCNINSQDNNGDTPSHTAIMAINCPLEVQNSIFQKLIENSANLNIQNKQGNTPLHFACQLGNFKAAKLLLENGADYNIKNKDNLTAEQSSNNYFNKWSPEEKRDFYELIMIRKQSENELEKEHFESVKNLLSETQLEMNMENKNMDDSVGDKKIKEEIRDNLFQVNQLMLSETINLIGEQELEVGIEL